MSNIRDHWHIENTQEVDRNLSEWIQFVKCQEERIKARLNKYDNLKTEEAQLDRIGEILPCQEYQITLIRRMLRQTLDRIKDGTYGKCIICFKDIPEQRLLLIPGVARCIKCENYFPIRK